MSCAPRTLSEDHIGRVRQILDDSGVRTRNEDIAADLIAATGITKRHAALIARDQVMKYNANVTRARHEDAGITSYTWRTSEDERVRPDHEALDGQVFSYADPPVQDEASGETGNPGEGIQCRCTADPIIPGFDDDGDGEDVVGGNQSGEDNSGEDDSDDGSNDAGSTDGDPDEATDLSDPDVGNDGLPAELTSRPGGAGPLVDPAVRAQREAEMEAADVAVVDPTDAARHLERIGAQGSYIMSDGEAGILFLPPEPSRSAALEEYIHFQQHRDRNWRVPADLIEAAQLEVDAAHMILDTAQREGWTEAEIAETEANLRHWKQTVARRRGGG